MIPVTATAWLICTAGIESGAVGQSGVPIAQVRNLQPALSSQATPGLSAPAKTKNLGAFCGFDELLERSFSADPQTREIVDQENLAIQGLLEQRAPASVSGIIIPVVVYVVYQPADAIWTNVTNNIIYGQLNALNAVYAPAGVQFCLASSAGSSSLPTTLDPTGATDPGIEWVSSPLANHLTSQEAALKAVVPPSAAVLPAANFMRIWVVEDIDDPTHSTPNGVAGYARFPGSVPPALDGIVMRYDVFGDVSTCGCSYLLPNYDEGDVLAHEVGHYLNLYHTFQGGCSGMDAATCASAGDYVCDTPPVAAANSGCPAPGSVDSCNETPNAPDLLDNEMDYTNDICRATFTPGQQQRMIAAAQLFRAPLIANANLAYTGVSSVCTGGLVVTANADNGNPCVNTTVTFTAFPLTPPTGVTYAWDFGDGVTLPPGTTNPVTHVYAAVPPAPGFYSATVTSSNGTNSITDTIHVYVSACNPIASTQGNWYFGNKAALNFGSGAPVPVLSSQMNAMEAAATQSDASGNLLFYTDGGVVWDRTDTVMPNGLNVGGNGSAHQGVVIVPKPGSTSHYFIFALRAVEDGPVVNSLRYSEVDMALNGGLGDVVSGVKDLPAPLPNPNAYLSEAVVAAPHCNGSDYWVITRDNATSGPQFYVNQVTSAGPSLATAYAAGGVGSSPNTAGQRIQMDISPNGQYLAATYRYPGAVRIYRFDPATGTPTSYAAFATNSCGALVGNGICFSPNSNILYYSEPTPNCFSGSVDADLWQVDLNSLATRMVGTYYYLVRGELAPDNRIYFSPGEPLSVINFPNNFNTNNANECGLNFASVSLGGRGTLWSLPNMINAQAPGQVPPDFSVQQSNCHDFVFTAQVCGTTFSWDFGDGSPSNTGASVSHTYAADGIYTVVLTINGTTTVSRTVTAEIHGSLSISGPVCVDTGTLFNYSSIAPPGYYTYSWSITAGGGAFSGPTDQYDVNVFWSALPATLTLTISDPATGCTKSSSISVDRCACADLLPNTFTADRYGNLSPDRMQVVATYDGDPSTPQLTIHLINPTSGACCQVVVGPIPSFGTQVLTAEYDLNGFVPTGEFDVSGVVPNGVIDGIAFGLYWRDAAGDRWLLRSRKFPPGNSGMPDYFGNWPIAMSDKQFNALVPQLVGPDVFVQQSQARITIYGSQMLGNGSYGIPTGRQSGDVNADGCVNLSDVATVLSQYGSPCCP